MKATWIVTTTALGLGAALLAAGAARASALPIPVAPGSLAGETLRVGACPSFHWAGVDGAGIPWNARAAASAAAKISADCRRMPMAAISEPLPSLEPLFVDSAVSGVRLHSTMVLNGRAMHGPTRG